MQKQIISTDNAPQAIGTYSQAVKVGNTIYISGQIPLEPQTMQLVTGDFKAQVRQAFNNLKAIVKAADAELADIVKLTIYLTSLDNFATVNEVMAEFFNMPYPARAVLGVRELPKGADVEVEAIAAAVN